MGRCGSLIGVVFVVILAVLARFVYDAHFLARPDEAFAIQKTHNATVNPATHHSRLRRHELDISNQSFFQWWNFLVFDAEAGTNLNIIYGLNEASSGTVAKVGVAYRKKGSGGDAVLFAGYRTAPWSTVKMSNAFDMQFGAGDSLCSLTALDDNTYHLIGSAESSQGRLSWNLKVHRLNGYYGALDQESKDCMLSSTLFGYHSQTSGQVLLTPKAAPKVPAPAPTEITRTARFRTYAAGSWGCHLPYGTPAIEYPWTWFWLVVPSADASQDLSMVGGTGRFQTPVGPVEGGYWTGSVPEANLNVSRTARTPVSGRYIKMLHNTTLEFLLQASASHGYFSNFSVEQSKWEIFTDDSGMAWLPTRQTFRFASAVHSFVVDFHPTIAQYFRAPIVHDGKVFSDFRAVGVRTHFTVTAKPSSPSDKATVLFDQWVDTMNAVEFAYVAPTTLTPDGVF